MQRNIATKIAGYVAWNLIYKRCKFGNKIYYNSRDIEFFLNDYFYWCALYILSLNTPVTDTFSRLYSISSHKAESHFILDAFTAHLAFVSQYFVFYILQKLYNVKLLYILQNVMLNTRKFS